MATVRIPNPNPQLMFAWTYGITVTAKIRLLQKHKYQILKKEFFWSISVLSSSSNWSAPNASREGLRPPVPKATKYKAKKKTPICVVVALLHIASQWSGGFRADRDTDSVSKTNPWNIDLYNINQHQIDCMIKTTRNKRRLNFEAFRLTRR